MDELLSGTEQYYLKRLQLANWGTFSGIHTIDIAQRGHLFVGGSGSGKSTILDAMSVLLTPGRINFNAAARQGEKRSDRSFMSYIRGAWSSEQDSDGKAATKFLRQGSTWSAVALTYESNLKSKVTLLFVGYVRGVSREEQAVRRNYFVIPADFALESIADFAASEFNVRLIKKVAPESQLFPTFGPYFDCFSRYFGISDEKVLLLLHKAQSAKNMGDVNLFFREFMLEVPKTYAIAQTLVDEFSELNQAYLVVKKAREQVDVLKIAADANEKRNRAHAVAETFKHLEASVDDWKNVRLSECLGKAVPKLELELAKAQAKMTELANAEKLLHEQLLRLKEEHYRSGGEMIERLEDQLKVTKDAYLSAKRRQAQLEAPLKLLGRKLPATGVKFEVFTSQLRDERDALLTEEAELTTKRDEANISRAKTEDEFRGLRAEIELMLKQPTNIPSKYVRLRDELAEKLGVESSDLPFAGELLQIKPEESEWQGACERVLNQLSLSVLVADRHYAAFARAVNDRNLGLRLVYNRVTARRNDKTWSDNSVPSKFDIKAGPFADWLEGELAARFDYVCVRDTADFVKFEKAVTLSGQVKHTATRHEKNDKRAVGDRTAWITGFNNTERRHAFEERAQTLAAAIAQDRADADKLAAEIRTRQQKAAAAVTVLNTAWEDIDTATPAEKMHSLEEELTKLKGRDSKLQTLSAEIEEVSRTLETQHGEVTRASADIGQKELRLQDATARLNDVKAALEGKTPDAAALNELTRMDAELSDAAVTVNNADARSLVLSKTLNAKIHKAQDEESAALAKMTAQFAEFKVKWGAESADMDATEASAADYFALLERLESDGLPKYEERFRDLLENHAKQNLIDLNHEIENERREIKSRMKEVNDSLAEVAFNRTEAGETHLRIAVTERHLAEVADFKALEADIMREGINTKGQAAAEKYFAKLADLVAKLNPTSDNFRTWRERVLDVREHVSFQGIEFNDAGETMEVFASGAGKSGGQRQKLTMTCLVAALRYQLGGTRAMKPKYAPVVMDEAFDKADSEFTDISMRIFKDFGFQPIIATPEKGLFTLEPYMGSFSYVSCRDRKTSSVLSMTPEKVETLLNTERDDAAAETAFDGGV